jgi:fatty acid desaturase
MTTVERRDYSILGPEGAKAVQRGLVDAEWFTPTIDRKRMRELMGRSDRRALIDTGLWLGLLVLFGALGSWLFLRGSLWWIPVLVLLYGPLYGTAGDSRWHEAGHGTAFRTRWMNDVVYQIACFMMVRSPTAWRWSHTRHHTDTIIVGQDPEIITPRPPAIGRLLLNLFGIVDAPLAWRQMLVHAAGRMGDDEKRYVPESEYPKVYREARVWVAIYAAVLALTLVWWNPLPLLLVPGPRIYGTWLHLVFGVSQHIGLAEDVTDHRLNSRTIRMNPVFRFLYWNMNYHVEHHIFPNVPFHALPDLHAEIGDQLAPVYPSLGSAYREIIPTLARQRKDPTYFVERPLPA